MAKHEANIKMIKHCISEQEYSDIEDDSFFTKDLLEKVHEAETEYKKENCRPSNKGNLQLLKNASDSKGVSPRSPFQSFTNQSNLHGLLGPKSSTPNTSKLFDTDYVSPKGSRYSKRLAEKHGNISLLSPLSDVSLPRKNKQESLNSKHQRLNASKESSLGKWQHNNDFPKNPLNEMEAKVEKRDTQEESTQSKQSNKSEVNEHLTHRSYALEALKENENDVNQATSIHETNFSSLKHFDQSTANCDLSDNVPSQDKLQLSSWGLPEDVLQKYRENGICSMFPWQVECLSLPGVLEGGNLVYSAPTSAGKTLVAEIILLKRVLEQRKKGIFILPFVSVAREKTFYLQRLFGGVGVKVEGFMGGQLPPGGFLKTDIAVCTIEKANNIINRLIEEEKVSSLGMVVVDELHMVGDPQRGYLLELLLTKLQYVASSSEKALQIQIVGMSATLPNLNVLAEWLHADLYSTSFRPIPLQQMVKIGTLLYTQDFTLLRDLTSSTHLCVKDDRDHLMQLCLETVVQGFSLLLFCPAKAWCEKVALTIASTIFTIGRDGSEYARPVVDALRKRLSGEDLGRVLEALRSCPAGLDPVLERTLGFGAAFHHAGLTFDERDILEGAFRAGYVPLLVATSTLSSGVNLPARRVIVRTPNAGGKLMDPLIYKQMIGRAGRKGKDTQGESILMCASNERHKAEKLVTASLPPITSCLQRHASLSSSMKRAILEVVVSGAAKSTDDIKAYWDCTLLAATMRDPLQEGGTPEPTATREPAIEDSVKYLLDNELARFVEGEDGRRSIVGTQLGNAILAAGMAPDEGLHVFAELQRARQCFVLENELHVVYQVTPVYVSDGWPNLDWLRFLEVWEGLSAGMKRVGELVGIEESFIVRAMQGIVNKKVAKQRSLLAIHQRFYAALALHDLVHEVTLSAVVTKYGATKGLLQALQQSAATFAGMVTVFCNRLGWHNLELLIAQYQNRLQFGVQRDLCDLVRLPLLNGRRARILFDQGLETVGMVAHSNCRTVENILMHAGPFQSRKDERAGFILGPNGHPMSISEASKEIVNDARRLVQKELRLDHIDWDQTETSQMLLPNKTKKETSSVLTSTSTVTMTSTPSVTMTSTPSVAMVTSTSSVAMVTSMPSVTMTSTPSVAMVTSTSSVAMVTSTPSVAMVMSASSVAMVTSQSDAVSTSSVTMVKSTKLTSTSGTKSPSDSKVTPLTKLPSVIYTPSGTKVTPHTKSSSVTSIPSGTKKTPLTKSPSVTSTPSGTKVIPLNKSPSVTSMPSSSNVTPFTKSPSVTSMSYGAELSSSSSPSGQLASVPPASNKDRSPLPRRGETGAFSPLQKRSPDGKRPFPYSSDSERLKKSPKYENETRVWGSASTEGNGTRGELVMTEAKSVFTSNHPCGEANKCTKETTSTATAAAVVPARSVCPVPATEMRLNSPSGCGSVPRSKDNEVPPFPNLRDGLHSSPKVLTEQRGKSDSGFVNCSRDSTVSFSSNEKCDVTKRNDDSIQKRRKPVSKGSFLFAKSKKKTIPVDDSHSVYIPESQEDLGRKKQLTRNRSAKKSDTSPYTEGTSRYSLVQGGTEDTTKSRPVEEQSHNYKGLGLTLSESLRAGLLETMDDWEEEKRRDRTSVESVDIFEMSLEEQKEQRSETTSLNQEHELSRKDIWSQWSQTSEFVKNAELKSIPTRNIEIKENKIAAMDPLSATKNRTASYSACLEKITLHSDDDKREQPQLCVGGNAFHDIECITTNNTPTTTTASSIPTIPITTKSSNKTVSNTTKSSNITVSNTTKSSNITAPNTTALNTNTPPNTNAPNITLTTAPNTSTAPNTTTHTTTITIHNKNKNKTHNSNDTWGHFGSPDRNVFSSTADDKNDEIDESLVMTESGALSLTRENIEQDLSAFESSLLRHSRHSLLNDAVSESFLDASFEGMKEEGEYERKKEGNDRECERKEEEGNDRECERKKEEENERECEGKKEERNNQDYEGKKEERNEEDYEGMRRDKEGRGGEGGLMSTRGVPGVSPSPFDDFSSIILTPGTEAILEGKVSPPPFRKETIERKISFQEVRATSSTDKDVQTPVSGLRKRAGKGKDVLERKTRRISPRIERSETNPGPLISIGKGNEEVDRKSVNKLPLKSVKTIVNELPLVNENRERKRVNELLLKSENREKKRGNKLPLNRERADELPLNSDNKERKTGNKLPLNSEKCEKANELPLNSDNRERKTGNKLLLNRERKSVNELPLNKDKKSQKLPLNSENRERKNENKEKKNVNEPLKSENRERKILKPLKNENLLNSDEKHDSFVSEIGGRRNRTRRGFDDLQITPSSRSTSSLTSSLTSSSQELTSSLCIIDVAEDANLFDVFLEEWRSKERFAISLACQDAPNNPTKGGGIGWKICGRSKRTASQKQLVAGLVVQQTKLLLTGVAISWGGSDAYYINLKVNTEEPSNHGSPLDLTFSVPVVKEVTLQRRIEGIKEVIGKRRSGKKRPTVAMWHVKESLKILHRAGIELCDAEYQDPRVATWLLDPTSDQMSLHAMVLTYSEAQTHLLEGLRNPVGMQSVSTYHTEDANKSPRVSSAIESVLVFHLTQALASSLEERGLKEAWETIEMPVIFNLALMELSGMGFRLSECYRLKLLMQEKLDLLECDAYRLAGHPFSLSSPNEVAKVLYAELRLDSHTDGSVRSPSVRAKLLVPAKRGRHGYGPTNKDALEKLRNLHPLPDVILEWRKIKAALTKVVYPMSQEAVVCSMSGEERIFPVSHTFTATGRVTFHEPNIQNIPKDFDIHLPTAPVSSTSSDKSTKRGRDLGNMPVMKQLAPLLEPLDSSHSHTISLRNAIVAGKNRLLLAADYSQLELRILAHLSADENLLSALNCGEDVFNSVASRIYAIPTSEVSSIRRQEAKQICYGIIYGMSEKTLREQLGVAEEEARDFMSKFHKRFPRIREFVKKTLDEAKERGFVLTLEGRRRYLPALSSGTSSVAEKGQAERQAVNTRIQGSAADLVKRATVAIHKSLRENFPDTRDTLGQPVRNGQSVAGAFLVLQLHDELIYEVASEDVIQVAQIVKQNMEGVCHLSVQLPVKLKVGPTWGSVQTINL